MDYCYDNLGNRTGVTFEGGTAQAFGYDPVSRLSSLTNDLSGTTNDLSVTFAYNPASQIIQTVRTGDAYAFTGHVAQNTAGVANGLNQLTSVGGTAASYDAKGNLTSDPTSGKTYTYSSENLLTTGSGSVTVAYDPMTRLAQIAGAATTKFAYDGVDALAEYDGTGVLQRRFVFDPTTGQPVVQYEGTGVAAADRRYLSQDERGSVISLADSAGALIGINTYDEYGIPGAANVGRFQYTGQAWMPELALYYYKARMYSPALGRFAQPDPIGYADSPNLYNYVLGDPVNLVDPLGLCIGGGGTGVGNWSSGYAITCPHLINAPFEYRANVEPGNESGGGVDADGPGSGCILRGTCSLDSWPKQNPAEPPKDACGAPQPPASRTYGIPKGFRKSWDKQNRFVYSGNSNNLVMNPLYEAARQQAGGTNWKGVGVDLLRIGLGVLWFVRAGQVGSSAEAMWDVGDVLKAGGLVGSSGMRTLWDLSKRGAPCSR